MVPLRLDGWDARTTCRGWKRLIALACAAASLVVLGIEDAAAATRQWDGSSSTLWSDPANWVGDVAPVNGDDLLFPSFGSNTTNQNDIPGLQVNSVRFMFTSYLITGQPITLGAGGMIAGNGTGTSAWGLATTLSAAQTWNVEGTLLHYWHFDPEWTGVDHQYQWWQPGQ